MLLRAVLPGRPAMCPRRAARHRALRAGSASGGYRLRPRPRSRSFSFPSFRFLFLTNADQPDQTTRPDPQRRRAHDSRKGKENYQLVPTPHLRRFVLCPIPWVISVQEGRGAGKQTRKRDPSAGRKRAWRKRAHGTAAGRARSGATWSGTMPTGRHGGFRVPRGVPPHGAEPKGVRGRKCHGSSRQTSRGSARTRASRQVAAEMRQRMRPPEGAEPQSGAAAGGGRGYVDATRRTRHRRAHGADWSGAAEDPPPRKATGGGTRRARIIMVQQTAFSRAAWTRLSSSTRSSRGTKRSGARSTTSGESASFSTASTASSSATSRKRSADGPRHRAQQSLLRAVDGSSWRSQQSSRRTGRSSRTSRTRSRRSTTGWPQT